MGYYTRFEIKADKESLLPEDWQEKIDVNYNGGQFQDSVKWYNWKDDMKAFSKKYPTVLFTLKGEGEESGDIWVAYFLNGKMQHSKAKIVYEKFDKNKLI